MTPTLPLPVTWRDIPGWFDFQAVYDRALRESQPGDRLVEVGCFCGKSLTYLAQRARDLGKLVKIYGVDWFQGTPSDTEWPTLSRGLGSLEDFAKWTRRAGVLQDLKLLAMPSRAAQELFPPESCRMVFLDADHSYVGMIEDLSGWWPKVVPGGILAGHDFRIERPGMMVRAALDDWVFPERLHYDALGESWLIRKAERTS